MRLIPGLVFFLSTLPALAQIPPSELKKIRDAERAQYEASLKFVDVDASKAQCSTPGARVFLKVDERIVYTSRIYWTDGGLVGRTMSCNRAILRSRANNVPLKLDVEHGEIRPGLSKDQNPDVIHVTNLDDLECNTKTAGHHTISLQGLAFSYQPLIGNYCQDALNTAKAIHGSLDINLREGTMTPVVEATPHRAAAAFLAPEDSGGEHALSPLPPLMPTRLDQPAAPASVKEVNGSL